MKKYLVIGNPIEHSLSPKLHNHWIKKYKINATYDKVKLNDSDLGDMVSKIRNNKITGINITVPFKQKIIPHLDSLSPIAKEANSVNTIYKKGNKIVGDNTDIEGFKKSIRAINFEVKNKEIFIIGAGGVALSIIVALKKLGVAKINITNRTISALITLKKKYPDLNIIDWGKSSDFDLVINSTSLGLKKDDKIPLDFTTSKSNKVFYDVIYSPKRTNFLLEGYQNGNKIENGIKMFIFQAQLSFYIWHKVLPDVTEETVKFLEND